MSDVSLVEALERSEHLRGLIEEAWATLPPCLEKREVAVSGLCRMSVEHCQALQALLPVLPGPGITLLRIQYESLVRAIWALYAASDLQLDILTAPLTAATQKSAKKLPGIHDMLSAITRCGPQGAAPLLARARNRLGDGLNSFVHGGIHPFARMREGYPVALLRNVLNNSNGMSMLTLILFAELTRSPDAMNLLRDLNLEFHDVLPALEPLQA